MCSHIRRMLVGIQVKCIKETLNKPDRGDEKREIN